MLRSKPVVNYLPSYKKTIHTTPKAIGKLKIKNPNTKKTWILKKLTIILTLLMVIAIILSNETKKASKIKPSQS